ncbi:MAG TPA: AI-2E family transporter [Microlunatus sp.]|nr:AI-2E family transporter [Microlunatus sp.]
MAEGESFRERMARWRANGLPIPHRAETEVRHVDGRADHAPALERVPGQDQTDGQTRRDWQVSHDEHVSVPADDSIDVEQATGAPATTAWTSPAPSGGPPAVSTPVPPETIVAAGAGDVPSPLIATSTSEFDRSVPRGLQIAAAWSWRVIIIAIMVYGVGLGLRYISEVVIPVAVAILLAAMIAPLTNRLTRWGLPRAAAAGISVVGGLLLIVGALTLIGTQIAGQAASLGQSVISGFNTVVNWLQNGPLNISADWFNLDEWGRRIQSFLVDSQGTITTYASEFGAQVGHFLAGIAILLFSLFYFLYQGRAIFSFLMKFIPRAARDRVDHAAREGWTSLSHYVRAVVLVALVDAIGVLIGALILGVPLAPALAALVFIGAFIPIVGAFISGFVAVLVALVALGWVKALIMLAIIIGVMQLEGHVLQPFLLGRAVRLHPLAVILAIAIGVVMAGIVGALMAVPLLAYIKTFVQDLNESAATGLQSEARAFR